MKILRPILLIGLLFVTASCDDTFIDPFDNDGQFFTLYGYLDVIQTEHAVRVIPVTRTPEHITSPSDDQATIDAVVTSTDLSTGQKITWQHTLVGSYEFAFRVHAGLDVFGSWAHYAGIDRTDCVSPVLQFEAGKIVLLAIHGEGLDIRGGTLGEP